MLLPLLLNEVYLAVYCRTFFLLSVQYTVALENFPCQDGNWRQTVHDANGPTLLLLSLMLPLHSL